MESVPCNPNNEVCGIEDCPTMDTHHLYFPRRDYKSKVEKTFRNLPENKVHICRMMHEAIHRTAETPVMPDRDTMLNAIDRSRDAQSQEEEA